MNWQKYWKQRAKNKSLSKQVGRTRHGKEIKKINNFLVEYIIKNLKLKRSDICLDLCCGNGQITKEIAKHCKEVYAIDFEKKFINQIRNLKIKNVKAFCKNIKDIQFKKKFDKILFYAGIQYFEKKDVINIFKKLKKISNKNSIILIGDIPDQQKIWNFYSNDQYLKIYTRNLLQGKSIIGNWFDKNWLIKILQYYGFKKIKFKNQNKNHLNYKTRFDILIN